MLGYDQSSSKPFNLTQFCYETGDKVHVHNVSFPIAPAVYQPRVLS